VGLSEGELAERSGSSVQRVRELKSFGILVEQDDGRFSAKDVHRVRLMQAFDEAGIDLEVIARGISAGKLGYENIELLLSEPSAFSTSYEEIARDNGRSPEAIRRLLRECGLAQVGSQMKLRDDDAEMIREILDVWRAADDDELAHLARAYGQNIRRLVTSDLKIANSSVFARLRESGLADADLRAAAGKLGVRVMALGERMMIWLRSRHLEHEVISVTVQGTEEYLQELGEVAEHAHPPAIAFLDLTGYTAQTEERGDEAGADLADRLAALVNAAGLLRGGHPVKWLGDGVMFHFPDATAAVLTGLDLVEQTPIAVEVRARVGVNAGRVIFRDGDYFGRTVNVASRIADYSRPGEILVSEEVKQQWHGDGVAFQPIGPVALKGLKDEITLYSATRS
jgi:adenylate cyclase